MINMLLLDHFYPVISISASSKEKILYTVTRYGPRKGIENKRSRH